MKFAGGIVLVAAVAAGAVYVAREVDALAGALVVLGALIAVSLVLRLRAARDEKSGMADWEDVLESNAPDDAFFSEWTMSDDERSTHAADGELVIEAHTAAGLESLGSLEELLAGSDATAPAPVTDDETDGPTPETSPSPAPATSGTDDETSASASDDEVFPFDDPSDTWGDLPPLPGLDTPAPPAAGEPAPVSADHEDTIGDGSESPEPAGSDETPLAPAAEDADPVTAWDPTAEPGRGFDPLPTPTAPAEAAEPVGPSGTGAPPDPGVPVTAEADAYSLAGVGQPSGNGTSSRRSIIDWSGPVHAIDEQVRTSDDILAASAATALPTSEDRPAPSGGSELTRLLSKVEARLRDYE
ncbi:hypothetical protein [Rhabdothermincola salaria]|uniref:hypothetical protein n=1 Tax=Rhabdothermincola salaria TaxID=2903142 RepID=UPI001E560B21|nr:hypothetical protein [Rhabdothermincola salaria]MCD9623548.1 hypothetical protein [Rhabdothermincola salaria]